jgi:subtilase family serine protease
VLRNHVRTEVTDHRAAVYETMPLDQPMRASIVLPLRNKAALTSLLQRLYDPTSPEYRHFLSMAEFTDQFGPTSADFQAVVAFAKANGLTVTDLPSNRLVVPVAGTAAQINAAFNVQMTVYQHPTENRTFFSPDREPSLNLSVAVAHIAGLDNFSLPRPMSVQGPGNLQAETVAGSGPGGAYLGSDMRGAYYGGTMLDGNGQSVGILEFGGYDPNNVNLTFSNAGQTTNVPVNNVLLDGATAGTAGDDTEQVLDAVNEPEVALIVTVACPGVAALLADNVSTLVPVDGFGENDAVTPLGSPDALNAIFPAKPY